MNIKKLYLSTAILAALALVTYFIKNSGSSAPEDPRVGQTIAENETFKDVTKIRIRSADESFTLAADPDGSQWVMEEMHSLPVDGSMLGSLRSSLLETRLERLVSTDPERLADFGFGDRSIALLDSSGKAALELELGRNTDTGKQLVKFADEDKAFIADDQFSLQSSPTAWLDKTLIELERDDARSVSFALKNGDTLTVSRASADEEWSADDELPAGKQLDQGAVTRALNRFASIRFTDLMDPESPEAVAATANSHTISVQLEGGDSYDFTVGRRPEVRVTEEVESENEDGEIVTETEEVVETPAGPVRIQISASDPSDPINGYMQATAFEVGAFLYTNLPESLDSLLSDLPEPEPEAATAEEPVSPPEDALIDSGTEE